MRKFYIAAGGLKLMIQECDAGWDWTVWSESGKLLDGGVIDDPDLDIDSAAINAMAAYGAPNQPLEETDDFLDDVEA